MPGPVLIGIDTGQQQIILKPIAPKSWLDRLRAALAQGVFNGFLIGLGFLMGWVVFG